jgi:hypothetical protein
LNKEIEEDLAKLRRAWSERRARLKVILRRFDTRGMTRPARDADERAWLEERRQESGPFVEDERAAAAARAYYERRYRRPT